MRVRQFLVSAFHRVLDRVGEKFELVHEVRKFRRVDLGEFQFPLRQLAQDFFRDGGVMLAAPLLTNFAISGMTAAIYEKSPRPSKRNRHDETRFHFRRLPATNTAVQDLIAKAETLLEALPYIQKFSGATFVVKYGGSFMDSPDDNVRTGVARDIVFLEAVEINPVVVHGGGKAITRAMEKAGLKANFIQGQRVTDEATAKIVDDVLSREINPEIVKTINALGGKADGLCRAGHFQMPQALARRQGKSGPEN